MLPRAAADIARRRWTPLESGQIPEEFRFFLNPG
jgi:hypothetical protein